MTKRNFVLLALICLFSSMTFAKKVKKTESWDACLKDSDCEVTEEVCYTPKALNKKYVQKNEEENSKRRVTMQCAMYVGPRIDSFKASCQQKRCQLEKPRMGE